VVLNHKVLKLQTSGSQPEGTETPNQWFSTRGYQNFKPVVLNQRVPKLQTSGSQPEGTETPNQWFSTRGYQNSKPVVLNIWTITIRMAVQYMFFWKKFRLQN